MVLFVPLFSICAVWIIFLEYTWFLLGCFSYDFISPSEIFRLPLKEVNQTHFL